MLLLRAACAGGLMAGSSVDLALGQLPAGAMLTRQWVGEACTAMHSWPRAHTAVTALVPNF